MWWRNTALNWRQWAPHAVAVLLGAFLVADLLYFTWVLAPVADARIPSKPLIPLGARPHLHVQRIVRAHLFGEDAVPAKPDLANAPDTRAALALTGIIAMTDPTNGYAILGEKGKPTHLYRTGEDLVGAPAGRLYQVFVDRVILYFDGRLETLRLPRYALLGARQATAAEEPAEAPHAAEEADQVPSAAETWLGALRPERQNADGKMVGMLLHPDKRYQRSYGLQEGDLLTAINGVDLTDEDVLTHLLKIAGKSLSLTLTHDGVSRTVDCGVNAN